MSLHASIFFWFVEAPGNKSGNTVTCILFPVWQKILSRSIHIAKVVIFNILEVHNHYTGEDSYLYSCFWAPLNAPAVLVCILCTTNAWVNTQGIAFSSVLVWSFDIRGRLEISAVWEVQPLHECSFLFHEGLYRIYTKIKQSDPTVGT